MAQKTTAKASKISYKGVDLSITKYTVKVDRKLADSTGSDNYDAISGLIQPSQLPVSAQMSLAVEGLFDEAGGATDAVIADVYSDGAAADVVLTRKAGALFGHGKFDIKDFEVDVEPNSDKALGYKCTLMQNGIFTPGA